MIAISKGMAHGIYKQKALRLKLDVAEMVDLCAAELAMKVNPWIEEACEEKIERQTRTKPRTPPAESDASKRARLRKGRKR